MKKLLILLVLTGCRAMLAHDPYLPPGETPCLKDEDCSEGYVCGFSHVDTYASCQWRGPGDP